AGRSRSRRDHARGNRDVDPGRDHHRAKKGTARDGEVTAVTIARSVSDATWFAVIPGWSAGPDLRCAIAHRGISRFRVRIFDAPRNDVEIIAGALFEQPRHRLFRGRPADG